MKDEQYRLLNGSNIPFKAFVNEDESTYSMAVKEPVQVLPNSNELRTIYSLSVPLASNTPKTFLAIKNTSPDVLARLGTFNVSVLDNREVLFILKVYEANEVTGTFTPYPNSTISSYSVDATIPAFTFPNFPLVGLSEFGTIVGGSETIRFNLLKNDVLSRWGENQVLTITALCKNANTISFFVRHIEEF